MGKVRVLDNHQFELPKLALLSYVVENEEGRPYDRKNCMHLAAFSLPNI